MGMKAESSADLATLLAQAGWLRRFARALVGDPAAAEDLAQETMLSALSRPASAGGRAWLATVARNLAVDRFRGNARRQRREQAAHADDASAGHVASPEELIGDAQIHRHVAEAVARLAEPFRQTVVLRFYEGLSAAEIARRLGAPEGTIRWRLKEALDRVCAELDVRYGNDRSAWRAALAPLLPAPRADAPPSPGSGSSVARKPAMAAATSPMIAMVATGVLAMAISAVVVGRALGPHARMASDQVPSRSPADEATPPSAAPIMRVGLPSITSPVPATGASTPSTPGRPDAQSLAEELLAAIEGNDYDAFVAKGSPSFRAAAGQDRLDAANAALAGRLSRGHHVSALGNVHRRRGVDWFLKIAFDDGGDDALCTLAMDGWQVAGFLVTDVIPELTESHHE
jgi:RNA polymerase sigma factor (sigma-70 family)